MAHLLAIDNRELVELALDIDPTFPSHLSVPAHPVVPHGADGLARLLAHGLDANGAG